MQVSFKALEQAVQKIQKISDVEFSVVLDGTNLVFRLLTPDEENDAIEFGFLLNKKRPDYQSAISSNSSLGNCIKTSILVYSLCQIGDLNFKHQEFLESPEGDKPRHEVLADLILKNWDSSWIVHLYMTWMTKSLEEGVRITSKVKIDLKSVEDQLEFHKNEMTRLQEKLSQFSTETAKQKLNQEIEREERESALDRNQESLDPPQVDLLPNHQSSFLSSENPEESIRIESQRQALLQQKMRQEQEKKLIEQKLEEEARLVLEFQKEQERKQQENPPENVRTWENLPPVPIPPPPIRSETPPGHNRGVHKAVSSLQNAYQTGNRILVREPEEYLDQPNPDRRK